MPKSRFLKIVLLTLFIRIPIVTICILLVRAGEMAEQVFEWVDENIDSFSESEFKSLWRSRQ